MPKSNDQSKQMTDVLLKFDEIAEDFEHDNTTRPVPVSIVNAQSRTVSAEDDEILSLLEPANFDSDGKQITSLSTLTEEALNRS